MASTTPRRRANSSSGASVPAPTSVSSLISPSGSSVALVHDPQTVERQPGLVMLNCGGQGGDERRQASGGHHGALAQLLDEAAHEVVDLAGEAMDGARLDRLHGRLPDHV